MKQTTKWAMLSVSRYKSQAKKYQIDLGYPTEYIYTDNPMSKLHELLPWEIEIDCNDMEGIWLGLYINCLLAEGYYLDYKQNVSVYNKDADDEEKSVTGGILYFKITEEYMGKLIDELERKKQEK